MLRFRRSFGWKLSSSTPFTDFQLQASIYHHTRLKTSLTHLQTQDPHKACAILFPTTPDNDKGAPHCLERLVLCGSQRYPVRDPFLNMQSRSLNTYLDSWTGAGFTAYPFSSVNTADFHNLLRVYLDSLLFPLLREVDFKHEAVRLEMTDKGLRFTGGVLEEMRSLMAEPDACFLHQLYRHMFPGTTYECNSGGSPEALTTLTIAELREFHQRFYHPSNARILVYGDLDLQPTLDLVDNEFLSKFQFQEISSEVPDVRRLEAPITLSVPFAPSPSVSDPKTQSIFAVSYLCDAPVRDPFTAFCLSVLSSCLVDNPKAPMIAALLESGLGQGFAPGVGYDASTREASFTLGVSGCSSEDGPKVEKAIMKVLQHVMENGLDPLVIESAIHQSEIKHKEVQSDFGLRLISSMMPYALHSGNPFAPLRINEFIAQLRMELAQSRPIFQSLVRKFLWDNPHKVILTMYPDAEFERKQAAKESKRMKLLAEQMDLSSSALIVQQSEEIKHAQDAVQNLDVLPTVSLEDVTKEMEKFTYTKSIKVDEIPVHFLELPTNGITYLRLKADVTDLPLADRDLLPLYTRILSEISTKANSTVDFDTRKSSYTTAGLACTPVVSSLKDSIEAHRELVTFSVGFLDRNLERVFDLVTEVLTQPDFASHSQLSHLIQRHTKSRREEFLSNYVDFAVSLACSSLTSAANSYEVLSTLRHDCGLAGQLLQALSSTPILESVERRLVQIHRHVLNKNNFQLLVHTSNVAACEEAFCDRLDMLSNALRLDIESYLSPTPKIPAETFTKFIYQAYLTIPGNVNYVVESYLGVSFCHPDYAILSALAELMTGKFLKREVKEKGGAVSTGFINDPHRGTLSMYSYRDPRTLQTYNAFERAITQCAEGTFDQRELDEAKLKAFAKIDKPAAVHEKGLPLFFYEIGDDLRQTYRERLLQASREDVIRVTQHYLMTPLTKGLTSKVIFGTEEIEKDEFRKMGWMISKPIDVLS